MSKNYTTNPVIFNLLHSNMRGGIEQMYVNYSHVLTKLGYHVVCIVPSDFLYNHELQHPLITLVTLDIKNYYDYIGAFKFHRLVKFYTPAFIFSHKGRSHSLVYWWKTLFSRFIETKIKTIGVCHGCTKRMHHFDNIIAVNPELSHHFNQANFHGKVHIVPNFLLSDTSRPFNENSRTPHLNTMKHLRLGTLSRLSSEKNLNIAIEALSKVKNSHTNFNFELLIAGDGEEKSRLQHLAKKLNLENEVKFLGWIHNRADLFENIDILLLPSSSESFGMSILEAFSHQVAVVASYTSGPRSIINNGENGLLFNINDTADLVNKIIFFIENPNMISKLGYYGHQTFLTSFSDEMASKKIRAILSS